jgi:hypothetical protein
VMWCGFSLCATTADVRPLVSGADDIAQPRITSRVTRCRIESPLPGGMQILNGGNGDERSTKSLEKAFTR